MFTKQRALHQQVNGADVTGELPTAALLTGFDRGDGGSTGHAGQEEALGYRAWTYGWAGCLDAPERLPCGSVRPVNISPEVGGYGYEGNVASNYERGAA